MKTEVKRYSRVLMPVGLAALAVVTCLVALGLFQAQATPVVAAPTATTITMTLAVDRAEICMGSEFTVTATFTNTGTDPATNITVPDDPLVSGSATKTSGPSSQDFELGLIDPNNVVDVIWTYKCDGEGQVDFEVTAQGSNTNQVNDTASIQQNEPKLEVIIDPIADHCPCDDFDLTFLITNTGTCTATNVTYDVTTSANVSVISTTGSLADPLPAKTGVTVVLTDNLHCDAPDLTAMSSVTVTPDGKSSNGTTDLNTEIADTVTFKQDGPELTVEITDPISGTNQCPSDNFDLDITITNNGECTATNVIPLPSLGGMVEWAGGIAPVYTPMTIAPGDSQPFNQQVVLHCTGKGDAYIDASAEGYDTGTPPNAIDTSVITDAEQVLVNQLGPVVTVDITEPVCPDGLCPCEETLIEGTVAVTVCNSNGVTVTIDPGLNAEVVDCDGLGPDVNFHIPMGPMNAGDTLPFSATIHCVRPGDSLVEAYPDESSLDGNDNFIDPADLHGDSVTIEQGGPHLVAEIIEPCEGCDVELCSDFPLLFQITNVGECSAYGVKAHILPSSGAEVLGCGEGMTKTTPYLGTIAAGESIQETYTMHCLGVGASSVTVEPFGFSDPDWDYEIDATTRITPATANFDQVGPSLMLTVTAPTEAYCSTEYEVEVEVANHGTADAHDVIVMLPAVDGAEWVWGGDPNQSGHPQTIDCLKVGESEILTWKLHCTGDVDPTFTAKARCADCCEGWATDTADNATDQMPLPLDVKVHEISPKYVGEQFTVMATITNTGDMDATNVWARLPDGDNFKWISGGTDRSHHKQHIPYLQPGETWTVSWVVECTKDMPASITVQATNDNACGIWEDFFDTVEVTQLTPVLDVDITSPDLDTGDFMVVYQTFQVKAKVTSYGVNKNAYAKLTLDEGEALEDKDGEWLLGANPMPLGHSDMGHMEEQTVEWTVRCTNDELLDIEVDAFSDQDDDDAAPAYDEEIVDLDEIQITQKMPEHPLLSIGDFYAETTRVTDPGDEPKAFPGQTYSIVGWLCNDGEEPALETELELDILGDAELVEGESKIKKLGTIYGGQCQEAKWTVVCTGAPGRVDFEITGTGADDITGDDLDPAFANDVYVLQFVRQAIDVKVSDIIAIDSTSGKAGDHGIVSTDRSQIGTLTIFEVEATVENTGYADLEDIELCLSWDWPSENADEHLDVGIPGYTGGQKDCVDVAYLAQEGIYTDTWEFHCPEGADIYQQDFDYAIDWTAEVEGYSEICDCKVEASHTHRATQKDVVVDITTPLPEGFGGPHVVSYGYSGFNCFTVTAEIHNRVFGSQFAISSPSATITTTDDMDVTGAASKVLPTLDQSEFASVSWEVCCTAAENGTIMVTAGGFTSPDSRWRDDRNSVDVEQIEKAHLTTEILSPTDDCVGRNTPFDVVARITNEGEATAADVWVDIINEDWTVTGGPFYGVDGELTASAPFTLTQGESLLVAFEVTPEGYVCDDTFSVQPYGNDLNAEAAIPLGNRPPAPLTLQQVPMEVEIYQHPAEVPQNDDEKIHTSDSFGVSAVITNVIAKTDCYSACTGTKCDDCDVTAILHMDGPAGLVLGEDPDHQMFEKHIGIIPGGTSSHAEWTVHCERPGDVEFWVEVVVDCGTDHCLNAVSIYDKEFLAGDPVTVPQYPSLIKYTIPLAKEWNVMSLPLIPADDDIADVLWSLGTDVDEVWAYDAGEWHVYWPGVVEDDLTQMVDGEAYFVQMYEPGVIIGEGYSYCDLTGGGEGSPPPAPPEYLLDEKWNLVGFTTCDFNDDGEITQAGDGMMVGHYLSNLDQMPYDDLIVGKEASFFRYFEPGDGWNALGDGDNLWVGKGYWLYASEANLSIVPPLNQ